MNIRIFEKQYETLKKSLDYIEKLNNKEYVINVSEFINFLLDINPTFYYETKKILEENLPETTNVIDIYSEIRFIALKFGWRSNTYLGSEVRKYWVNPLLDWLIDENIDSIELRKLLEIGYLTNSTLNSFINSKSNIEKILSTMAKFRN